MFSKPSISGASRHRPGFAFTLVEMMVTVVVMAILVAFLLPASLRQVEAARSADCVARLRHLGVAVRLWRIKNNEELAPSTTVLSWRPSRHLFTAGVITSAREMCCASVNSFAKGAWSDAPASLANSPYKLAFYNQPVSYAVNTLAFNQTTPYGWGSRRTTTYKMFLGRESQVPVFFDGKAWKLDQKAWADEGQRLKLFGLPHRGRAQVLFLDGHVQSLDREAVLALQPLGGVGAP